MRQFRILSKGRHALVALALLTTALPARAERVDNFQLLDQHGAAHDLYYLSDREAVVIMIQGNGCPISRNAWPVLSELRDRYEPRGVSFLMLNSNLQDDRASILEESRQFGIDLPILVDETQVVGEGLDLIRTGEVLVIDPDGWELVYRGPIDDRLTYERQQAEAKSHYLSDTLEAVLAGKPVEIAERDAVGCLINFPYQTTPNQSAISYSETVAPILIDNCVACHQAGGVAPWAMSEYRMVLGFAPMIREVLRTRRMPPWHSDPHVGSWVDDRSLSNEEIATLVHWVESGAPRGDGPDPLEQLESTADQWPLGPPDLILTVPAYEVPATGVVEYQYPTVANPLDHDVWVKAVSLAPGDRTVVHHILAGYTPEQPVNDGSELDVFQNYLHGYAPGAESAEFPDETGVLVKAGGAFVFQMHYTPVGKASRDESRMALYFYDEPPAGILRHNVAVNLDMQIPPGDPAHAESAYLPFDRDAVVYSLFPHAHYRGRSSKFMLQYPDGSGTLLLSVPKYDFNWQREYRFEEPLFVPAGSKIVHTTVYDNSAQNSGNPDPSRAVPWGLQSWDEMLYGAIRFRWVDETSAAPFHDQRRAELEQFYGYTDRDMDGKLSVDELPDRLRPRYEPRFEAIDADGDGGISIDEFAAANRRR